VIPGAQFLQANLLTDVMDELQDVRLMPPDLTFTRRTPMTPATDGEILARMLNRVQIADLVTDDARALTYRAARLQLETTTVPNIKHGTELSQEDMNRLEGLRDGMNVSAAVKDVADNLVPNLLDDLRTGCLHRVEALIVAMHLDAVSYNRFGIKVSGGWNMPADLKVTPSVPWTDAANATPVNDIWAVKRNASVRYGRNYDRGVMSTSAFILMISTAEFQTKARVTVPLIFNYGAIPTANLDYQKAVAVNILGFKELELYDARYFSQDETGASTNAPFLPINKVILTSTMNDGNRDVQDFANSVVTESVVSGFLPNAGTSVVGNLGGPRRGPISYATVPPDLNPPAVTLWGVMRGFPRKKRIDANAVLTIGTFTDTVSIVDPYA
jgi:hypothetical protein